MLKDFELFFCIMYVHCTVLNCPFLTDYTVILIGRELCDKMCKDGASPEEIVEFFKTFVSKKMKIEVYMKNFLKNHKTSDKVSWLKNFTCQKRKKNHIFKVMCPSLS